MSGGHRWCCAYLPAGSTKWELIGHEKLRELNSLAFVCGYSPADAINSFIYFLFCNPSLLDAEVFHYSGHRWLGSRRRRVQTLLDHLLHILRGAGGRGGTCFGIHPAETSENMCQHKEKWLLVVKMIVWATFSGTSVLRLDSRWRTRTRWTSFCCDFLIFFTFCSHQLPDCFFLNPKWQKIKEIWMIIILKMS